MGIEGFLMNDGVSLQREIIGYRSWNLEILSSNLLNVLYESVVALSRTPFLSHPICLFYGQDRGGDSINWTSFLIQTSEFILTLYRVFVWLLMCITMDFRNFYSRIRIMFDGIHTRIPYLILCNIVYFEKYHLLNFLLPKNRTYRHVYMYMVNWWNGHKNIIVKHYKVKSFVFYSS